MKKIEICASFLDFVKFLCIKYALREANGINNQTLTLLDTRLSSVVIFFLVVFSILAEHYEYKT